MSRKWIKILCLTVATAFLITLPLILSAQTNAGARRSPLITEKIDESKLHTLAGNTHPRAIAANDRGRVEDSLAMEHMMLQLQRRTDHEQALGQFIDSLHNPREANYHHWVTAAQFGQSYGAAQADIDTITAWLGSHGFTVNAVYPNNLLVDFSGNAGQVRAAFHTEIHYLDVEGARHVANISDPQIPAALAPAIAGVVSMHDFRPRPMRKVHPNFTFSAQGSTLMALVPADLATIYNLNPLFSSGYAGQGQTIAVVEDSDLYNNADYTTFRTAFGLDQIAAGGMVTVQPNLPGRASCVDPGVANGDDGEAATDVEWASAAAPGATVQLASCANGRTTDGIFLAIQNLVNSANPPAIISVSYGMCEAENGVAANAAFNNIYQQAVAEGISVFVAAGDNGAAGCDGGTSSSAATAATHGIGVSAWASTPYNVAVGGTDFADTYNGTNSSYWATTNSPTFGSAMSYIPEIPWNDSCASSLLALSFGYSTTYGSNGFCGSRIAQQNNLLNVVAGSGGPSGCATGQPSALGVVSGTCQGYAKPSWQAGAAGLPNDGARDLPDVSLFAGDGVWGHFYVECWSNRRGGGASCAGDPSTWAGAGGTSFAAPVLAGIQALVNQKTGSAQGNPNYAYYQLAAGYTCNSSSGDGPNCVFHNVTQGDNDVNCDGAQNCFGASTSTTTFPRRGSTGNGALSLSSDSYNPAYGSASGWNFATGLGSVNAYNLVNNWPGAQ